jgi:hypothetical protein
MPDWIEMCVWLGSGEPCFNMWMFQTSYFVCALRPQYSAIVWSLKFVAVCQNTLYVIGNFCSQTFMSASWGWRYINIGLFVHLLAVWNIQIVFVYSETLSVSGTLSEALTTENKTMALSYLAFLLLIVENLVIFATTCLRHVSARIQQSQLVTSAIVYLTTMCNTPNICAVWHKVALRKYVWYHPLFTVALTAVRHPVVMYGTLWIGRCDVTVLCLCWLEDMELTLGVNFFFYTGANVGRTDNALWPNTGRVRATIVAKQNQIVTYSMCACVCVALGIQHAMRMSHIVICGKSSSTIFSST